MLLLDGSWVRFEESDILVLEFGCLFFGAHMLRSARSSGRSKTQNTALRTPHKTAALDPTTGDRGATRPRSESGDPSQKLFRNFRLQNGLRYTKANVATLASNSRSFWYIIC